jgi:hypothetical protein
MRTLTIWIVTAGLSTALLAAAPNQDDKAGEEKAPEPAFATLRGLPATDGRQILASDEHGNAYILQLDEKRVFEIDGTGSARFLLELESEKPLRGATMAAVGAEGTTWVFRFAPFFVRVFENGEEVEIEQAGPVVTGMTVTGGRPTLALASIRPDTGIDLENGARPPIPPLLVQLGPKGAWRPWAERQELDFNGDPDVFGLMAHEVRLAGDGQGRILMARENRYDVREYAKSGRLTSRLTYGEPARATPTREEMERIVARRSLTSLRKDPEGTIEGVAWSPEGEVVILASTKDGYALDRWVPALQDHDRLPLDQLAGARRLQLAASLDGLLVLPTLGARKVFFLPWDYLREADWQSLGNPDEPGSRPAEAS